MSLALFNPHSPSQRLLQKAPHPTLSPEGRGNDWTAGVNPAARTLRELYESEIKPLWEYEGKAPATFSEFATAVSLWGEFWSQKQASVLMTEGCLPCEPRPEEIEKVHLLAFRQYLASSPNRGSRTCNKRVNEVRTILTAAEITAPKVKKLTCRSASVKHWISIKEVERLYEEAAHATWPSRTQLRDRLHPGDLWQAAVVLLFNYGFRTQDLLPYERKKKPITWANIWPQGNSPAAGSKLVHEHGWLRYTPQKNVRRKPDPLTLPLPEIVRLHLDSIRPKDCDPDRPVFDLPYSPVAFRAQLRRIVAGAAIKLMPSMDDPDPHLTIKHLRKTCATHHNANERGIAPFILGHADWNSYSVITDRHYDNAEAAVLAAFKKFPQPEAFSAIYSRSGRQLRLF